MPFLSTQDRPHSNSERHSVSGWSLGVLWLTAYFLFFYSFTLPNSDPPTSRLDVWQQLPDILLTCVLSVQDGPPSGWQYFPQRLDLLFVAILILAGAWGLGHLVLRLVRVPFPRRSLERTVFAFGLGLSGLSLLTLGCGLLSWLSRPLLGSLLAACFLGEWSIRVARRKAHTERAPSGSGTASSRTAARLSRYVFANERIPFTTVVRAAMLMILGCFLLAMLLGSFLPPTDFDVKEYHLQGPKEFFQLGRIEFLPHNVYTSFPFLTEMLSLLAMVLRGDWFRGALAGKAVLMSFAPLTALTLFVAGRRWFSSSVGWWAAFIYLTTPWAYRISIIPYAEGGLTFYLFATVLAVGIAVERFAKPSENHRTVVLAGFLAGSAMACKYTGVMQVVIPAGLVLCGTACWQQRPNTSRWRAFGATAAAFILGTAVAIGPWLAKNAIETGNPVYPLMYTVFGGADWDAAMNAKWHAAHSPKTYALSDLATKCVDVTAKSDWLSPLLFGLAPLAFFAVRYRSRACWLWLYVIYLFLTWWLFTHRIDRFWIPLIPVVSLLAAVGVFWNASLFWRCAVSVCFVAATIFNLGFITTWLCGNNGYLVDLAHACEESETTERGIHFLNTRSLPPDAKVLCVGAAQVFDARFPLVYNTVFDRSLFQQWCARSTSSSGARFEMKSPDEIRRTFAAAGIAFVYVNWSEILRYRPSYGYTDFVTPDRFTWLQDHGILGPAIIPPDGYGDVKKLSQDEQVELRRWAPSLVKTFGNDTAFIATQIFPVAN